MDRRFLTILAVLVIIFGGIFVINQNKSDKTSTGNSTGNTQTTNHTTGENSKNVVVMEYGDYQCPICRSYYQPLKDASEKYAKNIHFQFRNLPLSSIHQNAFAGARAAEAAGLQGKYWDMHDTLYENQKAWSQSSSPINIFEGYAKTLGLNITQFKADYLSSKVNDAINADTAAFNKTKQEMATPTFFLDGKYVANSEFTDSSTGGPSAEKINKYINDAIAKKASSNQ